MTNLKHLIETSDFCEIYNRYAVWIADPKNKAMYFRNGKTDVKMGFSNVKSPYGLEAFLKSELRGKIPAIVGQRASKYLLEEVETIERDANIFSEMFPNIIATKKNKLAEVQRKVNNTLNEHFEQASIEFPAPTTKTPSSEIMNVIKMASECGVKSLKTPDGYEIQF